jgi:outer membrane receptor protein involved in Fe transport
VDSPSADVGSRTVQEVRVTGSRRPIGTAVVSGDEGRSLPGAFGDPLRTIDLMPGIVPVVSGLPFFYVRGPPPGNTGYFVDGVRVPLVFHLAIGPSVVHPALIDRVDFYPGGYPARFGRFIGGIVDAQTRGDAPAPTVQGNLRLLDVGGLAETPFAGGRGSALVAGCSPTTSTRD